ncbi:MAG: hypothetical protein ABWY55_00935 [Microbacterium sp.]
MPGRSRGSALRANLCGTFLVAVALSGCAAGADQGSAAPAPLPDGVSVAFVQLRSDVAARQAQVQVHNGTAEAIEIGAVTVTDPRFADVAARAIEGRASTVAAGSTVDIRVQLPPMACEVADGGMTVQLELTPVDGEAESVVVSGPLPDELDVIGPLHERECLAERVSDAAALSFSSFEPSPPGEPATLSLQIVPTGDAEALIGGIQTTNLLTFSTGPGDTTDSFPIGFEATEASSGTTIVELPLVPLRCDAHAVQEDKRGTVFTVEVEVDGEPGEIELAAPEDMRGRILTWVGQWCGFGS